MYRELLSEIQRLLIRQEKINTEAFKNTRLVNRGGFSKVNQALQQSAVAELIGSSEGHEKDLVASLQSDAEQL